MKVSDDLVQLKEEQGYQLELPCHDVNIRLYNSSANYRDVVLTAVAHMLNIMDHSHRYEDYPELKGLSGANVGIPFNIICYRRKSDNETITMLNPKIRGWNGNQISVKSNCGSLCLKKKIEVKRNPWCGVDYFDLDGKPQYETFGPIFNDDMTIKDKATMQESLTIQHEIEHNQGYLITTRHKIPRDEGD